jgi:hypothetical protein
MIPTDANGVQLRVQWRNLRDKILHIARTTAGGRGDLNDLPTSINDEYDEGAVVISCCMKFTIILMIILVLSRVYGHTEVKEVSQHLQFTY